jgi:hypothetical protein
MNKSITNLMLGVLAVFSVCSPAGAADWGSIKGRFVVDGTPTAPAPLVVNKDQFCIDHKPKNDAVVVGKDNALVNALIYLRPALGQKVAIHPDYEAKLKEPVELDNKGCTFVPHITVARFGQKLVVKNSDPPPVSHNTNLILLAFNPVIPAGDKTELTISKEGSLPTPVQCNIHPWMKGYLVALSHPYVAVSGEDGTFEIKNIPVGTHDFQLWHETPGYLKNLKFAGGTSDARTGRAKLKIAAGETLDLGDIKVPARVLIAK